MRTASRCFSPILRACWRKSLEVSTITVCPACSISTETRSRWSRGSFEVQVSHSHAIEGTPVEVPVPKKVSRISPKSKVQSLYRQKLWTLDLRLRTYLPPVMSVALNFSAGGAGDLANETYCMRRSA